jgi:hypothetical protein
MINRYNMLCFPEHLARSLRHFSSPLPYTDVTIHREVHKRSHPEQLLLVVFVLLVQRYRSPVLGLMLLVLRVANALEGRLVFLLDQNVFDGLDRLLAAGSLVFVGLGAFGVGGR